MLFCRTDAILFPARVISLRTRIFHVWPHYLQRHRVDEKNKVLTLHRHKGRMLIGSDPLYIVAPAGADRPERFGRGGDG
jgi:hypothetical protein